jgi:hypothetical protein
MTWSGGRLSSLREEVFVQYLYGSFREEVVKFQGRCFEELLTRKLDDVVRGEVVKFEGGGMCPISVFVPYFILWKNQKRVALDLHKKQCRDKGEQRPISKFCFFTFRWWELQMRYFFGREAGSRPLGGLLEAQRTTCGSLLGAS